MCFFESTLILGRRLPCFEAVKGILHSLLVVFDHVGVHLGVVTPYVALCAAIWDRTKTERRVLLLWLLKLLRKKAKRKPHIYDIDLLHNICLGRVQLIRIALFFFYFFNLSFLHSVQHNGL